MRERRDAWAGEARPLVGEEACRVMKVSSCHLSHMRQDGLLCFHKRGNAFLYRAVDVEDHAHRKAQQPR